MRAAAMGCSASLAMTASPEYVWMVSAIQQAATTVSSTEMKRVLTAAESVQRATMVFPVGLTAIARADSAMTMYALPAAAMMA